MITRGTPILGNLHFTITIIKLGFQQGSMMILNFDNENWMRPKVKTWWTLSMHWVERMVERTDLRETMQNTRRFDLHFCVCDQQTH